MKKHGDSLFRIGEITKIMGVTRKTLLVFEEMGLLIPAVKDEESGFRYYSADNMTQIRAIRSLQALGLTLKEVREYYYDTDKMDLYLQRLMDLRTALDKNIQMLQVRAAKQGDMTVRTTTLPHEVCFCRSYVCETIADASNNLRDTYIAAARTGKMSMSGRMFTTRTSFRPDGFQLMCCIPTEEDFDGPERVEFAATAALCIYYRGPYEEMGKAVATLMAYAQEHGLEAAGPIRSIYMEGPPNRGDNCGDYITQIAVPIKG